VVTNGSYLAGLSSIAIVIERHVPVLVAEVAELLVTRQGGSYIDGTVGAGGHACAILSKAGGSARLLGIDADPSALEVARQRLAEFGDRVVLMHGNFRDLSLIARSAGFFPVNGILLDLGLSSMQLADAERGFSFQGTGKLDMRFDRSKGVSAHDLLAGLDERQLAEVLREYGEERYARAIAREVVRTGPVCRVSELSDAVARAVPRRALRPALARTFQALRIATNDELGALREALPQAIDALEVGGRIAVIAFHSLEDRIVKRFFRRESSNCVCPPQLPRCQCGHTARLRLVTKRPIRPSADEVRRNPRSRSARLRVAERI